LFSTAKARRALFKLGVSKSAPSLIPPPNSTRANCMSVSLISSPVSLSSKRVVPSKLKSVPNYDHMPSISAVLRPLHPHRRPWSSQNPLPRVYTTNSCPHRIHTFCDQRTATQPISSNHFITPYASRIIPSAPYLTKLITPNIFYCVDHVLQKPNIDFCHKITCGKRICGPSHRNGVGLGSLGPLC
jgi:hypothetical protein